MIIFDESKLLKRFANLNFHRVFNFMLSIFHWLKNYGEKCSPLKWRLRINTWFKSRPFALKKRLLGQIGQFTIFSMWFIKIEYLPYCPKWRLLGQKGHLTPCFLYGILIYDPFSCPWTRFEARRDKNESFPKFEWPLNKFNVIIFLFMKHKSENNLVQR